MPDTPNLQPDDENVERTIDPESEVEQASLESFPASDAPAFTGMSIGPDELPADDGPQHPAP